MPQSALKDEYLTYQEAADNLGLSRDYIAHLVSRDTLHPVKLPGNRAKYLHRGEIEWFQERREGKQRPNPYAEESSRESSIRASVIPDIGSNNVEIRSAESGEDASQLGALIWLLVVALLLAIIQHKQPDQKQLEQFKRAPELKPIRQAILKLAGEIPAA